MTEFVSEAKIIAAAELLNRTSAHERALRIRNEVTHHADLLPKIVFGAAKEACEAAELQGWMDAAAFLDRESQHHAASLLRAEKGEVA